MSETYQPWAPKKPVDLYKDEEIRTTPIYEKLRDGSASILTEDQILGIARDAIKQMWEAMQATRYSEPVLAVFDSLEEQGESHDNVLTIKLVTDANGKRLGVVEQPKSKGRKRFGHNNYAQCIGQGTPRDSALYRECVQALREKCGLDESALHGGFLLLKNQMRSESRNGVFELVIEKGREGNGVTDLFTSKLHQFPFVQQAVQTIQFPPQSGKKDELRQTDTIKEVPSMSQMLKQSILESAQTPAVMFGLVDLLKEGAVSDADDDGDDGEDDDEGNTVAATPARATASAAHALLDDDDEE